MNLAAIKPKGRPRDDTRDAAILEATVTVLKQVGYDRLTIEAVAAAAKASKATVYRRWADKAALVVDAMATLLPTGGDSPCLFPDTGTLRGDLIAGLKAIGTKLSTDEGKLMAAVMTAGARDPDLAAAMRGSSEEKRRSCETVVERAIARGELSSSQGETAFSEVVPALLYNRLLITGEPFDDAFIAYAVDNIALPLLLQGEPQR